MVGAWQQGFMLHTHHRGGSRLEPVGAGIMLFWSSFGEIKGELLGDFGASKEEFWSSASLFGSRFLETNLTCNYLFLVNKKNSNGSYSRLPFKTHLRHQIKSLSLLLHV